MKKFAELFNELNKKTVDTLSGTIILLLAAFIAFSVTYLMIKPGMTLDEGKASQMPGVDAGMSEDEEQRISEDDVEEDFEDGYPVGTQNGSSQNGGEKPEGYGTIDSADEWAALGLFEDEDPLLEEDSVFTDPAGALESGEMLEALTEGIEEETGAEAKESNAEETFVGGIGESLGSVVPESRDGGLDDERKTSDPRTDSEPLIEEPAEALTETLTEQGMQSLPETLTEQATESITEPQTEPATESLSESLSEPEFESLSETLTEQETESLSESLSETASETLTEQMTEDPESDTHELTLQGEDYLVRLTYTKEAGIPEGASLKVRELLPGSDEYTQYLEAANETLSGEGNAKANIQEARFFDITILDEEGNEIQPLAEVRVEVEYGKEIEAPAGDTMDVIHFDGETGETTQLEAAPTQADEDKGTLSAVAFEAEAFSVYGLIHTVEYTLEVDGEAYDISVTYGADAKIPDNADLSVTEIKAGAGAGNDGAENGDAGSQDTFEEDPATEEDSDALYAAYVAKAADALGWEADDLSYIRVFDIKIVDEHGEKVTIGAPVDVRIELADRGGSGAGEDASQDTCVVHFADESDDGEVVAGVDVEGDTIDFTAEGFSAYAIVTGPDTSTVGWIQVQTLEDLAVYAASGKALYIGNPGGWYFMGTTTTDNKGRTGIDKTTPETIRPGNGAVPYWLEKVGGTDNQFYAYCKDGNGAKLYVYNGGDKSLSLTAEETKKTAFTFTALENGVFEVSNGDKLWNMQGGTGGSRFCSYDQRGDVNNQIQFWGYDVVSDEEFYDLNGKTYGLMNWNGGTEGKAMMAGYATGTQNRLTARALTVMTKLQDPEDRLFFLPEDDDVISLWKFNWITEDQYKLSADNGAGTVYLQIGPGGLSLTTEVDEASQIQVIPGNGIHAGEVCLKVANATLTYSGSVEQGFGVNGTTGSEWLHLAEGTNEDKGYYKKYTATKISVSDPNLTGGEELLVYTRFWNDEKKRYDFYAIDHDGTLVPCFESGDSIEWIGGRLNTLLWTFTQYVDEKTNQPNHYYELFNEYEGKYLVPQFTNKSVLSDKPVGINLNGRRDGKYYTPILTWDDPYYHYAGLKVGKNGILESCPKREAMDFYFAIMQEDPVDDALTTVPTIDNDQHGIEMKMVDIKTRKEMSDFFDDDEGGITTQLRQGLLSTNLGENGYPTATKTGLSLKKLYGQATPANHLFIESIYKGSGYYEYDSQDNFASLNGEDFTVYKELGSYDSVGSRDTLKHGQFFPYNKLSPGVFATVNGWNLFSAAAGQELPDEDPRKYERLYLVKNPDYYFGMELKAEFVQTPSGLDAWGHDIIFEFSGDDDFWLYVDGELVIDLGGIHSAVPGSVNFRTGQVNVNGTDTTLIELFRRNYEARDLETSEAEKKISEIFEQKDGQWVFKDNTKHTMKIFYMERGAGASNLHMRFNLASVKSNCVELSKQVTGTDGQDTIETEFPYQIFYRTEENGEEKYLTNMTPKDPDETDDNVYYKDTINPVKYQKEALAIDGVSYEHVFFLKSGETAEINFPKGTVDYRIVECGVNTDVYDSVTVNGDVVNGEVPGSMSVSGTNENGQTTGESAVSGTNENGQTLRKDFGINYAKTTERPRVAYENHVKSEALRTLTISKKLFMADGTTPISHNADGGVFKLRLYLGTEYDQEVSLAQMYPYYVKDPEGNYCYWSYEKQKFISTKMKSFSELSDKQKEDYPSSTSDYGTISKIPVDYTVEIRDLPAGTKYMVAEWDKDIPDGYSRQKYVQYPTGKEGETTADPIDITDAQAAGMISSGADPHVDVCNLKGWGLRMNKIFSDESFMADRESAYFAVFIEKDREDDKDEETSYELVPNTVRELPYGETTLSWYFPKLPENTSFDSFVIREVILDKENPECDENGFVSDPVSVTPILDHEPIQMTGRQKGESDYGQFLYTVTYRTDEQAVDSNVKVTTVTNRRPGIVLVKQDLDSNPVAEAKFTLKRKDTGEDIGSYTSDENGLITIAYLQNGRTYLLTEDATPSGSGLHGLYDSIEIRLNEEGKVTLKETDQKDAGLWTCLQAGADGAAQIIRNAGITGAEAGADANDMPVVIIRNRPYAFRVIKIDKNKPENTLSGATFALYQLRTVLSNTDYEPVKGCEKLVTGEDGILPEVDEKLPAGSYKLQEIEAPNGYMPLSGGVSFTIDNIGRISRGKQWPEGTTLTETIETDGSVLYELRVPNEKQHVEVRFRKVDANDPDHGELIGAEFDLIRDTGSDQKEVMASLVSGENGVFKDETGNKAFSLEDGTYRLAETKAPSGYNTKEHPVTITVSKNGMQIDVDDPDIPSGSNYKWLQFSEKDKAYIITVPNQSGYELPATGGIGTTIFYIGGTILLAAALILLLNRYRTGRRP